MDKSTVKDFCFKTYHEAYTFKYEELTAEAKERNKNNKISSPAHKAIETSAQKYAITRAIILGMKQFPDEIATLWHCIYEAHIYRKSGIEDMHVIQNVIKADQSWKKSSGHAFEEMIKELATLAMEGTPIRFYPSARPEYIDKSRRNCESAARHQLA